jgi:ABC-type multidrug transport system fused ATPase/permease subunit
MIPKRMRPKNVKLVRRNQPTASQRLLNGELDFVTLFTKAIGSQKLNMDFNFQNLQLQLPSGAQILQGVSGNILHGRMTAIMGPSGAGSKSMINNSLS